MIRLSKETEGTVEFVVIDYSQNKNSPRALSIIVPTLNRQSMLNKTLESLICLEEVVSIIVVDDASKIKVEFNHPKVRVIRNEKTLGEGLSVNAGLRHVSTQFVAVISDDDPQGENWLPEIFNMIDRKPGRIAYAPSNLFIQNGLIVKKIIAATYASYEIHHFDFMPCLAGVVIDMQVLDRETIDYLRSDHIYPNDFLQWLRLSQIGKIQAVPRSFAFWHIHDAQTSAIISLESKAKMYLENVTDWKKANLTRFIGIALAATLIRYFQLVIIRNRKRGNDIPEILRYVAKYISISSRNKFIFFFEIFFAFFYLSLRKVLTSSINLGILIYLRLRKK